MDGSGTTAGDGTCQSGDWGRGREQQEPHLVGVELQERETEEVAGCCFDGGERSEGKGEEEMEQRREEGRSKRPAKRMKREEQQRGYWLLFLTEY